MIFEFFLALILVSLILIAVSFGFDLPILALLGFSFIFALGMLFYNGSIDYKIGEEIQTSSYFNASSNVTDSSEFVYNVYDTLGGEDEGQRRFFGVFMSIIGAIGFALTIAFNLTSWGGEY